MTLEESGNRFSHLSKDYEKRFRNYFRILGIDFERMQQSIFEAVKNERPELQGTEILDIGIGDGATAHPFVEAGCTVTGIDLDDNMIAASQARFGEQVTVRKMDATDMRAFVPGQFPVIVAGSAFHNIPLPQRGEFWKEIKRLAPELMVFMEKVRPELATVSGTQDFVEHQRRLYNEATAITETFADAPDTMVEWLRHTIVDEQHGMTMSEIQREVGDQYEIIPGERFNVLQLVVLKRKKTV